MTKEEAYKIVFEDLKKVPMFMGKYDAKHGNPHFMYGVETVIDFIADNLDKKTYDDFCEMWNKNILESERR